MLTCHVPSSAAAAFDCGQGACFQGERLLLVTEYMEGGNLTHNVRAKKVNWYRRGKRVSFCAHRICT